MDRYTATLELLTPDEIEHALRFVGVMERASHMDADEAGEWRWRIEAWQRFLSLETRTLRRFCSYVFGVVAVDISPILGRCPKNGDRIPYLRAFG